jgi:hypothetical protein
MVDFFIESYNFAVYDGFVQKVCKSPRQNRKSSYEIMPYSETSTSRGHRS